MHSDLVIMPPTLGGHLIVCVQATEFARLRKRAGLDIAGAACLLGVRERSVRRYEDGSREPHLIRLRRLHDFVDSVGIGTSPTSAFRFIDLFAGIGGLRLAMEAAGGKCVFTSEWDAACRETYAANFPTAHEIAGDIREFSDRMGDIPEYDVLSAGFPCQPFSIAGVSKKNALKQPHGFHCTTQGTLFFHIAQLIDHHRPAAFLLENVRHLVRHNKGKTFDVIMHTLREELGYQVHYRVVDSRSWVPQKRQRIFIVGFREKSSFSFDDFSVPDPDAGPKLDTILDDNDTVPKKYTLTQHLWAYLQAYKEKHRAKGNGFGYDVFGPDDVARTLSARYYKDGSEILISRGRGRPRRLTPRECARLMGFERHDHRPKWQIPVSDMQAYKQFGNAVVVQAAEAVALHMRPHVLQVLEGRQPLINGTSDG